MSSRQHAKASTQNLKQGIKRIFFQTLSCRLEKFRASNPLFLHMKSFTPSYSQNANLNSLPRYSHWSHNKIQSHRDSVSSLLLKIASLGGKIGRNAPASLRVNKIISSKSPNVMGTSNSKIPERQPLLAIAEAETNNKVYAPSALIQPTNPTNSSSKENTDFSNSIRLHRRGEREIHWRASSGLEMRRKRKKTWTSIELGWRRGHWSHQSSLLRSTNLVIDRGLFGAERKWLDYCCVSCKIGNYLEEASFGLFP